MGEEQIINVERRIHNEEVKSQVILGFFLLANSLFNAVEAALKVGIRYVYADTHIQGHYQMIIAFVKLGIVLFSYIYTQYKMKKLYFHSLYVRKLLFIWGVILIPVQLAYDISTYLYNQMLGMMWIILNTTYHDNSEAMYAMFYDNSHGFKYMGMFMAIAIGITVTGVILDRKKLIYISAILVTIFMLSFTVINMRTMRLEEISINIGINITSILFHILTTVGLGALSIYIIKSYSGEKSK